jgi:hypothetical protein
MSERVAVCPSFVTCVLSLSLSESVSSLFDWSNLSTLPSIWWLALEDAMPPDDPEVDGEPIAPEEPLELPPAPIDPEPLDPVPAELLLESLAPADEDPVALLPPA